MNVAQFQGIVDDHQIAAEPSQRTFNRGRVTATAFGCRDFAVRVPLDHHTGKGCLIKGIVYDASKIVRMGAGQGVGVGNRNHALRWVMAEEPSRQGHRGADRLKIARG